MKIKDTLTQRSGQIDRYGYITISHLDRLVTKAVTRAVADAEFDDWDSIVEISHSFDLPPEVIRSSVDNFLAENDVFAFTTEVDRYSIQILFTGTENTMLGNPETHIDEVPKTAEKFLYFFLTKDLREYLPGDLEEEYQTTILPKFGQRYANWWYWKQVLSSILPILWRRFRNVGVVGWIISKFT